MKKINLLLLSSFLILSTSCVREKQQDICCNGEYNYNDQIVDYMKADGTKKGHTGPIDPICKMVKNDDWELYTVQKKDTTWFCSDFCLERSKRK